MNRARIFFYVQHLLGIGHLRRATTLARALAAAGHDVRLVSGGMAIASRELDGIEFMQLPAVMATDMSFKTLLDADGRAIDDAWREARRRRLRIVDATCPLVTKVHLETKKAARDGFEVLLVGKILPLRGCRKRGALDHVSLVTQRHRTELLEAQHLLRERLGIEQWGRRGAGGDVDLDDFGEHALKGIVEPVRAWRVTGLASFTGRFDAAHGEALTPLVGREHELGLLMERWQLAQDGEGHPADKEDQGERECNPT